MLDVSASMDCVLDAEAPYTEEQCSGADSRMNLVREALADFFADPLNAGTYVALGTFGQQTIGATSCDPSDYSSPVLDFGLLPDQADQLASFVDTTTPTGETPTGAAISGACSHFADWLRQAESPAVTPALLLLTDDPPGAPSSGGCDPTLQEAVAAANDCLGSGFSIRTYVVGLGPGLDDLSEIAAAGDTNTARLVDEDADQLAAHLTAIVEDARGRCKLGLPTPSSGSIDLNAVNLGICDAGGSNVSTFNVVNSADCADAGGWYYVQKNDTLWLEGCEATCELLDQPGTQSYLLLGCLTLEAP